MSSLLDPLLPKTRQDILAVTLMRPKRPWYAAELARQLGVVPSTLQRELRDLTAAGILTTHRQGRMVYFQANTASPIYPELRGLMVKTAGLVDVLAAALRPLARRIAFAFVHGSMAAGTADGDSDVDLIAVGKVAPLDLALPLRGARDRLGRDVNPTVYAPAEFAARRAAADHFLTRVLDRPKLFVVGNVNDVGPAPG